MTVIERASREWAERPADQRFASLTDLDRAVQQHRERAHVERMPFHTLRAKSIDNQVVLNGHEDRTAYLTHWAFGQLAQRAGAPASYLRTLPANLAAACLNDGLITHRSGEDDDQASILYSRMRAGEWPVVRALTSPRYTRIWNADVTSRLLRLADGGVWQPAPAAFDGSRGLYASDQDMFAFMVDSNRRIFESLPGGGLSRGFFVWNSEVGAAAFGIMTFLYEYVCGNHRVWGAKHVSEIRIRHTGTADQRAHGQLVAQLKTYAESAASLDEARITSARNFRLGNDKEKVLDTVLGLRIEGITRKLAANAWTRAESREDRYGDPRSAWAFAGAITELSQDEPNASDRVALDRAAGRVMEISL